MRPFLRPTILIAAGIVCLFAWKHADFYFGPPHHETGDFAANALQIDDARHFQTLHGNYSRWRFHHPGPAFFYVYAAAEALLHRAIPVCASPHQAHAFAGLVLQACFLAVGLGLLAHDLRAPVRWILPAAAAMVYFRGIEGAFTSIWPPHALLGPFFAFVCACTAMAAGATRALPWAVLAGSFLVHGHVAQPLFVIPLFAGGYACLAWRSRRSGTGWPWKGDPRAHVAAGIVLVVFLLPIVVDLFAGAESNFAQILRHLSREDNTGKTLAQSVGQFLSFFARDAHPERSLDAADYSLGRYIGRQWPALAAWLGAATVAVIALRGRKGADEPDAALSRNRVAAAMGLAAALLALVWGTMQDGEMFAFNSHFIHALVFLLLLLALEPVTRHIEHGRSTAAHFALIGVAVLAAAGGARLPVYSQPQTDVSITERVREALERDGGGPIHLEFEHGDWPGVISVALAIQRAGGDFTVDPWWGFMFGGRHARTGEGPPGRVWRIRRNGTQDGEHPLTRDLSYVDIQNQSPEPSLPPTGRHDVDERRRFRPAAAFSGSVVAALNPE